MDPESLTLSETGRMPRTSCPCLYKQGSRTGQSTDTDRTGVAAGAGSGQCLLHGYNASLGVVQTV